MKTVEISREGWGPGPWDGEPLALLAVDEWHLGKKVGKLELGGPFPKRDGVILRKFINALSFRTSEPIEECFAQAVAGAKGELGE